MENKIFVGNNFGLTSHDLSISMIYDGKLYCIELERLFGIKGFGGVFSFYNKNRLFNEVLKLIGNISNYSDLKVCLNNIDVGISNSSIESSPIYEHHYLHACSAYFASNFSESAILVIDDFGGTDENKYESQTMWIGKGNVVKKIFSNYGDTKSLVSGIGRAYSMYSDFIGLEEGSVMGLSSYGNSDRYKHIEIFNYEGNNVLFNDNINLEILYGIKKDDFLDKNKDITKSKFSDIAAHLQSEVELGIKYLAERLYEETGVKNICIAGGVGLNILANTKILKETKFEKVFVQPAANDSGLSLGALYYLYYILEKNTKKIEFNKIGLGVSYENEEIEEELEKYKEYLTYKKSKNITKYGAEILNKGKIIGFFQGGSEFGPRALGNRSILTQSTSIETRDRVNEIKGREKWRPLAPVVLEEKVREYFELGEESPYMTFSSEVIEEKKEEIKGVVHVDGTARYQTINREMNEEYYDLLEEYYKLTGIPVLINTSFNVKGQPIVGSPRDAIETYLSTELDYLIIGDYIVEKSKKFEQFAFKYSSKRINLLNINLQDKRLYFKKWNLIKKILFKDLSINFCYGDNEDPLWYSDNKFSFLLSNIIITIEEANKNSGYFKIIDSFGIKFKYLNEYENNDFILNLSAIFMKRIDLIKKVFNITK